MTIDHEVKRRNLLPPIGVDVRILEPYGSSFRTATDI